MRQSVHFMLPVVLRLALWMFRLLSAESRELWKNMISISRRMALGKEHQALTEGCTIVAWKAYH